MLLALVAIFTLIESLFTALEVAMSGVSRSRLRALSEHKRSHNDHSESVRENEKADSSVSSRAQRVLELLERPRRLTFLFVGVTSLSLWIASCALMFHARQNAWSLAQLAASLLLILFVAEVLPLLLASPRSEAVSLRGVFFVNAALRVLEPTLNFLQGAGRMGARALGSAQAGGALSSGVTSQELRSALATAEEEGVIESDERALLEGAMDFREREVREVMTALRDVISIAPDARLRDVLKIALRSGHSRLPVFEGACALGIVAAKDILPFIRDQLSRGKARDVMRSPLFVQASEPVAHVLESLRRERSLMAIVMNEDATCGIVTLEDLLEEIVGAIQDEYDTNEAEPLRIVAEESSTRSFIVEADADVKVRELERFWRETFDEIARLQNAQNETPPSSQTLADFATSISQTDISQADISQADVSQIVVAGDELVVGIVWRAVETDDADAASASATTSTREVIANESGDTNAIRNAARPLLMRVCDDGDARVFRFRIAPEASTTAALSVARIEIEPSHKAAGGEM